MTSDMDSSQSFPRPLAEGLIGVKEQLDAAKYANDLLNDLDKELHWMLKMEKKLLEQSCPDDDATLIRTLYDGQQDINSEILARQQPIFSLCYQGEQLLSKHGDSLFAEQKQLLQKKIPETKARLDSIKKESDSRQRQLNSCLDAQDHYGSRLSDARYWQSTVQKELAKLQAQRLSSVRSPDLASAANRLKVLEGELYAHQGDLKALSSSAQKFLNTVVSIESSQSAFAQRQGQQAAPGSEGTAIGSAMVEERVREAVRQVVSEQNGLSERCRELLEQYNDAAESSRQFSERCERQASQLRTAASVLARLDGNVPTSRAAMQAQADKLAAVMADLAQLESQEEPLTNLREELLQQLASIRAEESATQREVVAPFAALKEQREQLQTRCTVMTEQLQTTIVQSQDLLATLRSLEQWLDGAEKRVGGLKPLSLNVDTLSDQERQVKTLEVEISTRQPSLEAAGRMIEAGDEASEKKLSKLRGRHADLSEIVTNRLTATCDLSDRLHALGRGQRHMSEWISRALESLDSRHFMPLDEERYMARLEAAKREKEGQRDKMESLMEIADELKAQPSLTDAEHIADRAESLERQWTELGATLAGRERELSSRQHHSREYADLRRSFLGWLVSMETRVGSLAPVALDLSQVERQLDELLPLMKEHEARGGELEALRVIGFAYDASLHGEAASPTSPSHVRKIHMTEVESELDALGERYTTMRDRLEDRKTEIENTLKRVSDFLKQMEGIIVLLDEKVNSALPSENIPSNLLAARRLLGEHEHSHEELLNLAPSLEDLKHQATDLLRNRDYVPGVTELREQLLQTDKKWAAMVEVSKGRLAALGTTVHELEEFANVRDSLRTQMAQKERMISVLGPVVTAPSLVSNQMQQVRVLQEDLEQLRPEVTRLASLADSLGQRTGTGRQAIMDDVESVQDQLHRLCESLRHREETLTGVMGPSSLFYELVNALSDAFPELLDRVEAKGGSDESPEEVLSWLESVEVDLVAKRGELGRAGQLCRELCATTSDPALQFDLKSKVSNLERAAREVQSKLEDRRRALDKGREETERFTARLDNLVQWVDAHKADGRAPSTGSYNREQLQDARKALDEQLSNVHSRQAELADLKRRAGNLKEMAPEKAQAEADRLADAEKGLAAIDGQLSSRYEQLMHLSDRARRFQDAQSRLNAWLALEEGKLKNLDVKSSDREHVQASLQDVEHLLREARSRKLDADEVTALGKELLDTGETDGVEVEEAVHAVQDRLRTLCKSAENLQRDLSRRLRQLQGLNEQLTTTGSALGRCEERWEALRRQPPSEDIGRDLDRVEAVLEELELCQPQLLSLESAAFDLAGQGPPSPTPSSTTSPRLRRLAAQAPPEAMALVEKALELQSRAGKLRDSVKTWRSRLKSGEDMADKSRNRADALSMRQSELENELGAVTSAAVEVDALKDQQKELKQIATRLKECADSTEGLTAEAQRLRSEGFPAPAARLEERLRQLRDQNARADKKCHEASERAAKAANDAGQFAKMTASALKGLEAALNKGAISPDGKRKGLAAKLGIKSGKDELKKFTDKHVVPLTAEVEALNAFGRDLLSHLPPGISARKLEHDLDKVNKKMSDLKERVVRQEHSLLDSQGQQERLDAAFKSMNEWIHDKEDLVASQKAPSHEYQVVKTLSDNQKLLMKMAKDQQGALDSLNELGIKVIENQSEEEARQTQEDVSELNRRFAMLQAGINAHQSKLEQVGRLAKEFRNVKDDLLAWIVNTEQRAMNVEASATDPAHIQRQIDDHKALVASLNEKQSTIHCLERLAGELSGLVDPSSSETLGEEVSQVEARLGTLTSGLGDKMLELLRLGEELGRFNEERNAMSRWLCLVDNSVDESRLFFEEPAADRRVVQDMRKLNKEIEKKRPALDNLTSLGQKLMKTDKKEDAEELRGKLMNIKQYYDELQAKGLKRQAKLEEALEPSEDFVRAHRKLEKSLPHLEEALRSQRINTSSEKDVERLENELTELEPSADQLRKSGAQLKKLLADDEMGLRVADMMEADLNRFEQVAEEVGRKAARFGSTRKRKNEAAAALEEACEWIAAKTDELKAARDALSPDLDVLQRLRAEQNHLDAEWRQRRQELEETLQDARKLTREGGAREQGVLKATIDKAKAHETALDNVTAEWEETLAQALPLATDFAEASDKLGAWMIKAEKRMNEADLLSMGEERLKELQRDTKALEAEMEDHKPLVEQLNKTGAALEQLLSGVDAAAVRERTEELNKQFAQLRRLLRGRLFDIDQVLSQTAELADQLDALGDNVAAAEELLKRAEPISSQPDKLKSQMAENKALMEDLNQRRRLLTDLRDTAADLAHEAAAVADRKDAEEEEDKIDKKEKLEQMRVRAEELLSQLSKVNGLAETRDRQLRTAAHLSGPFWASTQALRTRLQDLRTGLLHADAPACEQSTLAEQQEHNDRVGEELERGLAELTACQSAGSHLKDAVHDASEQNDVQHALDEVDRIMEEARKRWEDRKAALEAQAKRVEAFEAALADFKAWMTRQEDRLGAFPPVAMESARVKRQLDEIKRFKADLEPKQMDVEALNQTGAELARESTPDQKSLVQDKLFDLNEKWDDLLDCVNERQHKLQTTLLNLGEFEAAFAEVLGWIEKTDRALDDVRPVPGDPKAIEMEMAKHKRLDRSINMCQPVVGYMQRELTKMLQGDLSAYRDSAALVEERARELLREETEGGAERTQERLDSLNNKWDALLEKAKRRQHELEDALREALVFHGELQDVFAQMAAVEKQLMPGQPQGGLPESAREQLRRFEELASGLNKLESRIRELEISGENILSRANESAGYRLEKELLSLQQRWDGLKGRAADRQEKLQRNLTEVEKFHADLAKFIKWLTAVEKVLNQLRPVSRVVSTLQQQISDHRGLKADITARREEVVLLERTGTHLRYFSQKQDVIIIKNLLASVHHRWERVNSRSSQHTRHLEIGMRDASKLLNMWTTLTEWLEAQLTELEEASVSVGNDPATIKAQLNDHREWQRQLGLRQTAYDSTRRFAKFVRDRAPMPDHPELTRLMTELQRLWQAVCARSVERQRLLEEALLQSGQYKEAMAALLEWLHRVSPTLNVQQGCRGDVDTVAALSEAHKTFQTELAKRERTVHFVGESASQLLGRSDEDGSVIEAQLADLTSQWEKVNADTAKKAGRLLEAEQMAAQFNSGAREVMDTFAAVEQTLRNFGRTASDDEDEEAVLEAVIDEHLAFHPNLEAQKPAMEAVVLLGQEILREAHPDGERPVRQWINTLRGRYDELLSWSQQRGASLQDALKGIRKRKELLKDLNAFLEQVEDNLQIKEDLDLPTDMESLQELMAEQEDLEKSITVRQPDHDVIIRNARRKPTAHQPTQRNRLRLRSNAKEAGGPPKAPQPEYVDPSVNRLHNRWRFVWLKSLDRRKRLQDAIDFVNEVERMKDFDFEKWRVRYLQWIHHNKALLMDFFRRKDKDHDGRITRQEFIDGILESKFPTSRLEMEAVANIFDRDNDGYIDYKEFVAALRPPERRFQTHMQPDASRRTDSEKIQDEVQRAVLACTCHRPFLIEKVGEGKYRFGDSQKLRLVRILRSTVMVRVGGGWVSLDEYLLKNDPCRAKARANTELRERFVLAEGVAQSMAMFKSKSPMPTRLDSPHDHSQLYSPLQHRVHAGCVGDSSPKFGRRVVSPACQQHSPMPFIRPSPLSAASSRQSSRPTSIGSEHEVLSPILHPLPSSTGGFESRIPVAHGALPKRSTTATGGSSSIPLPSGALSGLPLPSKVSSSGTVSPSIPHRSGSTSSSIPPPSNLPVPSQPSSGIPVPSGSSSSSSGLPLPSGLRPPSQIPSPRTLRKS